MDDELSVERRIEQVLHGELPLCTVQPCQECPWVRTSRPGHLGPYTARKWCEIAHSEAPIMCHKTLRHGDHEFTDPDIRQCRGAAIFRANVFKTPRNPTAAMGPMDVKLVFRGNAEFIEHHGDEEDEFDE